MPFDYNDSYKCENNQDYIFIQRYDDYRDETQNLFGGIEETPDHKTFYNLAKTYASNNIQMKNTSETCPRWGYFEDGVTNGADW